MSFFVYLAAVPGTSNHEGGRAIDTSYYSYWLSTLQSYGWAHSYPDSGVYADIPDELLFELCEQVEQGSVPESLSAAGMIIPQALPVQCNED